MFNSIFKLNIYKLSLHIEMIRLCINWQKCQLIVLDAKTKEMDFNTFSQSDAVIIENKISPNRDLFYSLATIDCKQLTYKIKNLETFLKFERTSRSLRSFYTTVHLILLDPTISSSLSDRWLVVVVEAARPGASTTFSRVCAISWTSESPRTVANLRCSACWHRRF